MEEKLYDMIKESLNNQQESIKYLSDVVNRITESQGQTMLLLDETNRRIQEHADKESTNWRSAIVKCVLIICLMFVGVVAIYFVTPFESVSTSISKTTSINGTVPCQNDILDHNKNSELVGSDGD